jgi:hypothetical protein
VEWGLAINILNCARLSAWMNQQWNCLRVRPNCSGDVEGCSVETVDRPSRKWSQTKNQPDKSRRRVETDWGMENRHAVEIRRSRDRFRNCSELQRVWSQHDLESVPLTGVDGLKKKTEVRILVLGQIRVHGRDCGCSKTVWWMDGWNERGRFSSLLQSAMRCIRVCR